MTDFTPFLISLKVALISTLIVFVLGIAVARWLYRKKGVFARIIESFLILPLVLPPTVLGYILLIVFSEQGPLGSILKGTFHISVVFSVVGAVLASVIVSFPLMYQQTVQGFRSIDEKMLNTARTMGASESKIFFKLMLPLEKRAIIAGVMLAFARAIGEFGATLMVAGYLPGVTNTLPLEVYFLVEQGRENQAWLYVLILVAFSISVVGTLNVLNKDRFREEN
ncbi:molybdate ABC transporter permease subunit [Staphylococcus massiliensis]|uniref:Molybdenum transport system permease n=1 Tax=Staphylococcus massiliensis S46 TaxID=1229783 RepID=K9ANT9_9STAP|nr:molybdate ABC transporter permease subunit [Staphylococcus massiliensis]EKU48954.1 molybdenum ABC transporter permease [Staphylococcus massiliensis S46]MCG3399394.1 molybdate ABC transporter permease subunit [Staphylococcus massiliensis]MCG3402505.1 molybdate ABC transporter permease subunit [Staphylococcus massiliensis]MCG3411530.1 molybdate ABC transporter permease subunit [Staphylococcus massiliensis]PNZ98764.1 molybdate ABC transporter permease subunit [Staphylococcus massiliensis CCUG 